MFWYILFGFFAAIGALFLLWLFAGSFLPHCQRCRVLISCPEGEELRVIRRFRWLRDLGFVCCRLVLLDTQLPEEARTEMISHYPFVDFLDTPKERGSEPHDGAEP